MHNPIVLPQRKQLRLRGYDYAFPGAYFVTICSAGKRPVFGSISGESIVLSPAGEIVRSEWMALPERFSRLVLDEFVIMPNHLHGVLAFAGHAGGASPSPTTGNTTTKPGGTSPSPTTGNTTTKLDAGVTGSPRPYAKERDFCPPGESKKRGGSCDWQAFFSNTEGWLTPENPNPKS